MSLFKKIIFLLFLLTLAGTAGAQTENDAQLKEKLHAYLSIIHKKKGVHGELLIAQEGKIVFRKAIGQASVELNVPLEINAKYRIASITKTFTGALIAIAQQENKLHFDDSINMYIKGLSDKFNNITIHHLLTHTSGLPHHEGIPEYWQVKSKLQMNSEQAIAEINKMNLLFDPGSNMHYSSPGYYILATALEAVYSNSFENILKTKILQPLQMTSTGVANTHRIIPGMASGYHMVTDDRMVHAPYRNYSTLKGAGDMYATATDLLKWSQGIQATRILNKETKQQIFQPAKTAGHVQYGYGWFIDDKNPIKYFHGGGTWGYSSYLVIYPDERMSIILLSNVSSLPVESIASDIEKMIFGLPFTMPEIKQHIPVSPIDLKIYAGSYISESDGMKLNIIHHQEVLFAQIGSNPAFEIYPSGEHQFFGRKIDVDIIFEVVNNAATGLTAKRQDQKIHFKKVQ